MNKEREILFFAKTVSFFLPSILSNFFFDNVVFLVFFLVSMFLLSIDYNDKGPVDMMRTIPVCIPLLIFAAYGFYSVMYEKQVALSIHDCAVLCYTCLYSMMLLLVGSIQNDK